MASASPDPFSPHWWVNKLLTKLNTQATLTKAFEAYYDGTQPLPIALSTKQYRKEFEAMLQNVRDNWMPLVVDAVAERLNVTGFRLSSDAKADMSASELWQRNHLDADAGLGHATALTTGRCPIMVWADADGKAEITVEHPSQIVVAYENGSRRRRVAAIKSWCDEWTGETWVNLYLPNGIYKYKARGKVEDKLQGQTLLPDPRYPGFNGWSIPVDVGDYTITERESAPMPNPLGVVPIIELRNRMRLRDGHCRSEIMEVISTQDQIDKTTIDMLVASEFAAFRQRWATGVDIPENSDGQPVEPFATAVDRLWTVPDANARFGDFNPADLGQYVKVLENRVQSIAARTRTPPHYFLGQSGAFPSGESIKSAETGLVAKVRNRMTAFGEVWEEAIRLAGAVEGNEEMANAFSAEVIWGDPESRTESEHVDATMKKKALDVPTQQLWEDLGYTPQQIERFRGMVLDEALQRMLAGPAVPTTPQKIEGFAIAPPAPVA